MGSQSQPSFARFEGEGVGETPGDAVGDAVGDAEETGVGVGVGVWGGVGVGEGVGVVFILTPLFQINFFPDLIQVNFNEPTTWV